MKNSIQKHSWKLVILLILLAVFFVFAVTKKTDSPSVNQEVTSVVKNPEVVTNESVVSENTELPLFTQWEIFTKKDGLPSDKANCAKIDGDRVLIGTDKGLAIYQDNKWTVLTTEDGLSHNNILSIDVSDLTGDVWLATLSGLDRWSAGKFEVFNQFNSGLANAGWAWHRGVVIAIPYTHRVVFS